MGTMIRSCCKWSVRLLFVLLLVGTYIFLERLDGAHRMYYPTPGFLAKDIPDLTGKVMIVTGANVGLGKSSAQLLARRGAKVVLACRSTCEPVAVELRKEGKDALAMSLDLSDSKSIFQFAQEFRKLNLPINVLMLNAGVMMLPEFETTKDGFEMQIGTNWLGHFYLQHLLQDIVEKSAPSRVVIVTSSGHRFVQPDNPLPVGLYIRDNEESRKHYDPTWNYGASKLLNILHAKELDARMRAAKKDVTVIAVHPGVVDTELKRYIAPHIAKSIPEFAMALLLSFFKFVSLSAEDGALTQIWAATSPEILEKNLSGSYAKPTARVAETKTPLAEDVELRRRVWLEGEKLIEQFPRK